MPELYMICRVTKWENLKFESAHEIKIQPNEGQFGFCHVFDDYDKAVEFAGNESEIVPLKIREGHVDGTS